MNKIPDSLYYTEDHEWVSIENDIATVGITDFAQSSLGDIVFVELPEVGTNLESGNSFGVVESIKSVSDLYSPISGEVVEKNEDVESTPEQINTDAYGSWLIKIKLNDQDEVKTLLKASEYKAFCEGN